MFTVVYVFSVPRKNVDKFLRVQHEASKIYLSYGALEDATYASIDNVSKYGCETIENAVRIRDDEQVFINFARFLDKTHHDSVMVTVDSDPRIDSLYQEFTGFIDIHRVLRGEFERVA